jgi:hypothetical protein
MNHRVLDFIKLVNEHMSDVTVRDIRPRETDWFKELQVKVEQQFPKAIFLGSGYFSAAYQHPTDKTKVIKVGFKKEDSGAAYAAFCRQHQGEYGIPTIDWMERFEKVYFVIMKKYEDFSVGIKHQKARNMRHNISTNKVEIEKVYDEALCIVEDCTHRRNDHLKEGHPIFNTTDSIFKFFNGLASFDLHSENIMYDKELDQMIITDPVSFGHGRNEDKVRELENKIGMKPPTKLKGLQPVKIVHDEIQLHDIGMRGVRAGRVDWAAIQLPLHKPMLSKLIAHRPNHRELANNCLGFEEGIVMRPRELNIFKHGIELKPRMMNIKCNIA